MQKSDVIKTIKLVFKIILGIYVLLFFYMLFSLATKVHCGPISDVSEKLTLFSYMQELNIFLILIIDGFIFLLLLYVAMVILSKRSKTHEKHGKFLFTLIAVFLIFMFGLIPLSNIIKEILPTDSSEYCSLSGR